MEDVCTCCLRLPLQRRGRSRLELALPIKAAHSTVYLIGVEKSPSHAFSLQEYTLTRKHSNAMAKVPKIKKKEVNVRSRAGRRGESPETAPKATPKGSVDEPSDSWMFGAQSAGVHKKAPKAKKMTRAQRERHLKAIEHGERNTDRHETYVAKSKHRGRRTQSRRAGWEEVNELTAEKIAKKMAEGQGADMDGAESEEEIEETQGASAPDAMADLEQQPALPEQNLGQSTAIAQEPTPVLQQAADAEDIDEIL